jgi:hypothetical protein
MLSLRTTQINISSNIILVIEILLNDTEDLKNCIHFSAYYKTAALPIAEFD